MRIASRAVRGAGAALALMGVPEAHAATLSLSPSFFVDATSSTGSVFTFSNVAGTDLLAFTVSGTPTLQSPQIYGTNAAGVVTLAGSSPVGGSSIDPSSNFTFGSLILTLNGMSVQAFATNAADGLGSNSPPTTFSFSRSLQDIFGIPAGPIAAATIRFTVDDNLYSDNTGGFTVRAAAAAVPEPASWALMIVGFGAAGLATRRRAARAGPTLA